MLNPTKYLAEFLGTLLIVLCALVSGGNFLVVGAAVAVAVFFAGKISGGHVNPAITLALYVNNKIVFNDFVAYLVSQFAGGVSSVFLYNAVLKM
jgi:aquaporin Z